MKILKIFYESQTASYLKEIIQTHQIKAFYFSRAEIFLRRFKGTFQMLRECSFWSSRNDAVQMYAEIFLR